jgi:hypothetical protein
MYSSVPNIKTHSIKSSIPAGWRVMTLEEGKSYYKTLLPLLGAWSIVGFDRGKIDGWDMEAKYQTPEDQNAVKFL